MPKRKSPTSLKQKISLVALGILLTLAMLEMGLRLGGVLFFSIQEHRNKIHQRAKNEYRILCLGESTTALGGESAYPYQLEEVLNERQSAIQFHVINKGLPGRTTGAILEALEPFLDKYQPDMVVTMMGINDSEYAGIPANTLSARARHFLEELRVYKLLKLLSRHISHKIREMDNPRTGQDPNEDSQKALDEFAIKEKSAQSSAEIKGILQLIEKVSRSRAQLRKAQELYQAKGHAAKAQEINQKAGRADAEISLMYSEIGRWHRERGQYREAENFYQKALQINPLNGAAYGEKARSYKSQKRYDEAEAAFLKAIELNPSLHWAFMGLGRAYSEQGKYDQAVEIYQKFLQIKPKHYWARLELGQWLTKQRRFAEAEQAFLEAVDIDPKNFRAYDELAQCYTEQGKFAEAQDMYKKAIAANEKEDRLYRALGLCYQRQNKKELAKECFRQEEKLKSEKYPPLTAGHYNALAEKVLSRKIRLVCMQYPARSVEPLKNILRPQKGIIFVDNEKTFQEALKEGRYDEYFTDIFGGDFGHCTHKGNRLIAENLAQVILGTINQ